MDIVQIQGSQQFKKTKSPDVSLIWGNFLKFPD